MKIAVIGSGYVGLVTGACFAEFGVDVVCVDNDSVKIERLLRGDIPIFEPGLSDLVAHNTAAGRLSFTTDLAVAVKGAEAVFIAVGTPTRRGDGHADLSYVFAAAEAVAKVLQHPTVLVTKSTVPVGTASEVEKIVRRVRPDLAIEVASNPEFLREGNAIGDFMRPDRVVIGTNSERAQEVLRQLYRPLFLIETPIVFTSRESAEIIKYANNAFLAMKVAFINQISDLCEAFPGADVHDVAKALGLDGRIGKKFLHPGPGYGGSCFPKDTLALVRTAQQVGAPVTIIETVVAANEARKTAMAQRIIDACGGSVMGKTIAVLGLTFKPNTDDMRDAASLTIIPFLQQHGATVKAYDPEGMTEAQKMLAVTYAPDAYSALDGADAMVVLTEWNEFRALSQKRIKKLLRQPVVIDLRNIYDNQAMLAAGFIYHSLGRPPAVAAAADIVALPRSA